ncbi:unnamed protein product [Ilex paraguariensis]|uniref:Uncharacterized protein n=1 Tax=Ilex paraguariensis TaxID=185542 RepID=A0ABC8RZ13_9AQUA
MNVVRFLVGLKPKYEAIHSQILGGSSLPLLLEVSSRVQYATLSTSGIEHGVSTDCSALVVPNSHNDGPRGGCGGQGGRTRGRMGGRGSLSGPCSYIHYGRGGHTIDFCWDLHRKLSGAANQASYQDDTSSVASIPRSTPPDTGLVTITREEYAQFLSQQQAIPSPSTATFAQSGSQDEEENWYGA